MASTSRILRAASRVANPRPACVMGSISGISRTGHHKAAVSSAVSPLILSMPAVPVSALLETAQLGQSQSRTMATKRRKHRDKKKKRRSELAEMGIKTDPPSWHKLRDMPIINAVSNEERTRESREYDKRSSAEMKGKIDSQKEILRYDFTGLKMSDRVRKLFDLTNGNQKEVVKAQKKRGMELFQVREGDTGSSAVQGEQFVLRCSRLICVLSGGFFCRAVCACLSLIWSGFSSFLCTNATHIFR